MNPSPLGRSSPLIQYVSEALPNAARLNSFLVELNWDPVLGEDPTLAALGDNILHELHHQVALWGALMRLEQADPSAPSSVGLNLARVLHRRGITNDLAVRLAPTVRIDPRGQVMLALLAQSNRQLQPYVPLFRQVISATGWERAAPALFAQG